MATLLLVVIYTAYIGLGVPDSLLGSAWPAIYTEFGITLSAQSAVSVLISCCTVVSSLLSNRLINRFGTAVITATSTTMTAIALIGFTLSPNLIFLCLSAVPLGLGAGAIDAAQNGYVAIHYNARQMSLLHCFYGVGVALSPLLMSFGLELGSWRNGYFLAFTVQAVVSIVTIVALPLWKKVHPEPVLTEKERKEKNVSILKLSKIPAVRATWLTFIFSCSIETICLNWGSTYLVNDIGATPAMGARLIILYFVGLTTGRFVSGLLANKISAWNLIYAGCAVIPVAIILAVIPHERLILTSIALFLLGFGIGPVYPNLTHLTPKHFGDKLAQAVIGTQMAFAYIGILLSPILFGVIADAVGEWIFPYAQLLNYIGTIISMVLLKYYLKKQKR